ncbi:glycosyltransferase family 2 protein [Bizionia argentinensis JUB59]|uniref:Glycosyltransferase family 2 protein n=1 Tax=Bizionia argentinensis JUB59 TaxID=1046627 RepID=G2EAS2_9FLAO|nr:glycosyltransferase family 2 protein [Bizionia argentinensis]EGV44322.1 glycosyltransferase family 2 protein [Bizionia argentinensis JUB59]
MQPLVSIIIPTYNRAHLIGETLDSVLAQTYTNWECIVVDDGSTDETDALMKTYCDKDARFQYHHRPIDRLSGGNAARNYGFELSKGAYVNWFDSDDIMCENKLQSQLDALITSDYNFSVCQTLVFEREITNILGLRHEHIVSKQPLLDFIKGNIVFLTPSVLFKRVFLIKNNLSFDEDLKAAQDWEYFAKVLFYNQEYHTTDEPLVKIRRHFTSISHNKNNELRIWHYYLAREKLFLFLKGKELKDKNEILVYFSRFFRDKLKYYVFKGKNKESWLICYNTIKYFYTMSGYLKLKLYIKLVLITGKGYKYKYLVNL